MGKFYDIKVYEKLPVGANRFEEMETIRGLDTTQALIIEIILARHGIKFMSKEYGGIHDQRITTLGAR